MPLHMTGVIAPCRSCTAGSSHQPLVHTGVAKQQAVPRSSKSAIFCWPTQGSHVFQASSALTGLAVLASRRKRLQRLRALQRQAVAEPLAVEQKEARPVFPFGAVIGQSEMKLSLILNVIDPKVGGVMVVGDRGTGKTTTIRALVDLLPMIDCIVGDSYNSSPSDPDLMSAEVRAKKREGEEMEVSLIKVPMVDLPLGATEDRVCGTIDIEKALTEGKKAFEPGLLARANRGILYVDEVNLLDDHLVDVLLDSAASGWNTVEREGISVRHPAQFILVGSCNPEEGELRPQLLDRFGMQAFIRTESDPELRVQIVDACQQFADDPENFRATYAEVHKEFAEQIIGAQKQLRDVEIPEDIRTNISRVCQELDVDGIRGDIVTTRAARAYCAFDGRTTVTKEDVAEVISLCLRHRLKLDVMDTEDSGAKVQAVYDEVFGA